MFAPGDAAVRVDVQIIARGDSERFRRCLTSLVDHVTDVPFSITCVVNPLTRNDQPLDDLPAGVTVLNTELNLGWAGGLHLARTKTRAPYLAWAQEDMVVAPGWLDALVTTMDREPRAGAVGSVEVDPETHTPNGYAGGFAEPPESVGQWNRTDVLRAGDSVDGVPLDWITSKGLLTRARAFDDVHGTDPRLFPLNHVDKDYSIHLRAHGWQLFVAPDARLFHEGGRSSPKLFRYFLVGWQEPDFDARWGDVARRLGRGTARTEPHECATWEVGDMATIERLIGQEASLMLVPLAGFAVTQLESMQRQIHKSMSWRVTAPLRRLGSLRHVLRRRRDG